MSSFSPPSIPWQSLNGEFPITSQRVPAFTYRNLVSSRGAVTSIARFELSALVANDVRAAHLGHLGAGLARKIVGTTEVGQRTEEAWDGLETMYVVIDDYIRDDL